MSAYHAWPCYPPSQRRDWKQLSLSPTLFLSFLAGKLLQQTAEGKEKPLPGSRPAACGELQNLCISWPECFSRHLRECILTRLLSAFQPRFPKGLGEREMLSIDFICACLFLLTKAFRKRLVEISKIQWIYIFNCSPLLAQTQYFFFPNSFVREQFCKFVQFKIAS